jgi:imidazolonepropionase-like amidohydrolase
MAGAEHAGDLDLDSPRVQSFISLLREKKVVVDPTVSVFETMFLSKTGEIPPTYARIAARLPPLTQRKFLDAGLPVQEPLRRSAFQAMLKMIGRLHRAGIPMVAGTDSAFPGMVLHRELELYVQAGLPPPTVLQIATLGAARVMKHDQESGSLTAGKHADIIIVDGNPSEQISDIRKITQVLKGGMIYDSEKLHRAIGLSPAS